MRWVAGISALAAGAATALLPVGAQARTTAPEPLSPTYLFAVNAPGGTIAGVGKDTGKERLRLTLAAVSGHATQFTDRPFRSAYVLSTRDLVRRWDGWFKDSPPNAVLTFSTASDPMPHSVVLTLKNPRYSKKAGALTFAAWHIHRTFDLSPDAQQRLTLPKRRPPSAFRSASLFIDSVGRYEVKMGEVINGCVMKFYTQCPGVDLSGQTLTAAPIHDANLRGANLSGAFMEDIDLEGADLTNANLSGARLKWANLRDAHLEGADLTDADLRHAMWPDGHRCGSDGVRLTDKGWVGTGQCSDR